MWWCEFLVIFALSFSGATAWTKTASSLIQLYHGIFFWQTLFQEG